MTKRVDNMGHSDPHPNFHQTPASSLQGLSYFLQGFCFAVYLYLSRSSKWFILQICALINKIQFFEFEDVFYKVL